MEKNKDVLADERLDNYYMKKKETGTKTQKDSQPAKKENKPSKNKSKSNCSKKNKAAIIGLAITTGILGLTTIGFSIGYGVTQSQSNMLGTRLENVYQKNFFDLVDSVNNTEIKLSKILNSSTPSYQKKLLTEVSQNATAAEVSIASLPLEQSDINDNVRMVNQISGYTSTLADKLSNGGSITSAEHDTLQDIYDNILTMKTQLNNFARKMQQDNYNILAHSLKLDTDDSNFSTQMNHIHDVNTEYPTMIYDGPFSDSVTNAQIKGLKGDRVSKEDAKKIVSERFKNVISLYFDSETNGRFETFNFRLKNSDEETIYVQVSKIGGHILTVSGAGPDRRAESISESDAEKIALQFVKDNGIEAPEVVWKDTLDKDSYFNIAPKSNGIVLYPDLVKVKVDLASGTVVGYDATTYYTNHTSRNLGTFAKTFDDVKGKIPSSLTIVNQRKVLAPLDYNREVLCIEFECINSEDTYYFYLNAQTGAEENILKVIKTDDGSKLL